MNNNFDESILDNETQFKKRFKKISRPAFLDKNKLSKESKSRITILLDADILDFFKDRASKSARKRPVQNEELKMESGK